ncbi:MAG: hypothetical protein HXX09_05890 [Bacteroidetes bacterium]|nr:hypothetical protein [Bacteroidota bacterium]
MKTSISNNHFQIFRDFISRELGIYYTQAQDSDVERNLNLLSKEFGYNDIVAFVNWISSRKLNEKQIEIIANQITIGETYFFREKESYQVLKTKIIPDLIKQRQSTTKTIRIWSAGCCSGEEPYSIAILLYQLIPDIENWKISITGTDLNLKFLKKAEAGIYSKWSFRENSDWTINRYFNKLGKDSFEIIPEIKKMVKFSYLNLVEENFPSITNGLNNIDILFCRNVLMYFSPQTSSSIIKCFRNTLASDGWFLLSSVETNLIRNKVFRPVMISKQTFYKKNAGKSKLLEPYKTPISITDTSFKIFSKSQKVEIPIFVKENIVKEKPIILPVEKTVIHLHESEEETFQSALLSFENGLYFDVLERLEKFIENTGNINPEIFMLLARSYANIGKHQEAEIFSEKALQIDKTNIAYRVFNATILHECGKINLALSSYKKVLYLDPDFVIAHFSIATILKSMEKRNECQKHFNKSLELLQNYSDDEILEASEGLTAGRIREIITSISANI